MWRRRWLYLLVGIFGMASGVFSVCHPLSSWMSAEDMWHMQGYVLEEAPGRSLHTVDLLITDEGFLVHGVNLCRFIAADILQQMVGSIAHLLGAGTDRYAAFRHVLQALGPTASLALWLATSALVGAGMGVAALTLGRLLFRLARKAAEIPEEK